MNSCSNTDLEDCKYEPTGINAQFGYNTAIWWLRKIAVQTKIAVTKIMQ